MNVLLDTHAFLWSITGDDRLSKIKMAKIGRWVFDQYEVEARTPAISEAELAEQVRVHLPDHWRRATTGRPPPSA